MTNHFYRNCPVCGKEIIYKNKNNHKIAEKNKSLCKSCGIKSIMTEEYRKKISDRFKGDKNPMYGKTGNLNPFFGRSHSEETKRKIIKNRDYSVYKTDEFRNKISEINKGIKNPMYGKTVYDVWLCNHGKEVADKKLQDYKKKQSINNSGEKNSMYGKPAPKNSGNGVCGWYRGWFFRSILELSYMIFVIEKFNLKWESAEKDEFKVEYTIDGGKRNYFADFVIEGKYVVECKPKKLWTTKVNVVKFESAKKSYSNRNLIFKVRDIKKIKKDELIKLIDDGLVVLTNKWKNKITPK